MRTSLRKSWPLLLAVVLWMPIAGCKKKTTPVARPPVSQPARGAAPAPDAVGPTIEITASPSTIRRGEASTLAWTSSHAETVLIDSGVGNVETNGSISVSPLESTTYTATARGAGGETVASTRVTVIRGDSTGPVVETDLQALQKAMEEGLVRPVFFAYDSAELTADAKATLEENSKWFRRYPGVRIVVEGHCDERGTEEYNLALGDRRALAARDYLAQLGVPEGQMDTISFGEERPFVMGTNEAAWAQNRRAHFVAR